LVDDNGNCLLCWAHQEPLDPIIAAYGVTVVYLEHSSPSGTYQEEEIEAPAMESADTDVESALSVLVDQIDGMLNSATLFCAIFTELFSELLLWTRILPRAMAHIPSLFCGLYDEPNANVTTTLELLTKL
jgi:hypothetical protein